MSIPSSEIAAIRTDYRREALDEMSVGEDPIAFFLKWFGEALTAAIDEVNAMTLATCGVDGKPHARIVLLKGVEDGAFIFFTNYDSAKGAEIKSNNHAAVVFFWKELERQVRIEGVIEKLDDASSDDYFHSRPEESRLGAWASPQSQVIHDRSILDENYNKYQAEFEDSGIIPRPPHWGGYKLVPQRMEFWQGRSSRMHDRIVFERRSSAWERFRLAP